MLLEVKDLSISFNTPKGRFLAAKNVNFELQPNSSIGIVGESGSGKTVTALALMRLIKYSGGQIESGHIRFQGSELVHLPEREMRKFRGKKMAMIFQEPMTSLNPVFSVGDQIREAVELHQDLKGQAAKSRVIESMDLVGISRPKERYDFYPHQLSGGMRQRIMIAMALVAEPEILIADEPTTALDVTIQLQILDLISELQSRMKMSLILISHDFGIVSKMTQELIVMYAGEVVEKGPTQDVLKNPKHPYTRALQKASPTSALRGKRLYSIPFSVPSLSNTQERENLIKRWKVLEADLDRGLEDIESPKIDREISATLEVENLKVHYPIRSGLLGRVTDHIKAVDGVSFQIYPGEIMGLVGESGCGKSTLGKAIVHLAKPTSGKIIFEGKEIQDLWGNDLKDLRRKIQMVFQDPYSSLNPRMKISQILEEPLLIHHKMNKRERLDRIDYLLEKVGMNPEAKEKFPHEFSGGQRQRLGIARALAVEARLIIADEPVSALDVSIQAQILNLLHDLRGEFGLTYLFISHDLNVIQYLCDRVMVMFDGQMLEELSPQQIVDPNYRKTKYTEKLLSAVPHAQQA